VIKTQIMKKTARKKAKNAVAPIETIQLRVGRGKKKRKRV